MDADLVTMTPQSDTGGLPTSLGLVPSHVVEYDYDDGIFQKLVAKLDI